MCSSCKEPVENNIICMEMKFTKGPCTPNYNRFSKSYVPFTCNAFSLVLHTSASWVKIIFMFYLRLN